MRWLFLLFVAVPIVEVFLLVEIGQRAGFLPTVAGVLLVGAIGAWLAKREGTKVLREWQGTLRRGQLPSEGLTGAALVLVGGVLLVTPGVLTDVVGLALLFPPSRRVVSGWVRRRIQRGIERGTVQVTGVPLRGFGAPPEREIRGESEVRPNPPPDRG